MDEKKRVAVIGAGISGLVAAYELGKNGVQVDVFEAEQENGGFAGTFSVEGTFLEKYYHHFFKSDRDLLALLEELELLNRVLWRPSSMGYFTDGKVYDFGTPISLMKFSPLSFFGKLGFGFSTLRLLLKSQWRELEKITAEEWLKKNAGLDAYEKIWEPLLVSKFGDRAKEVSMAWFWGKIRLRGSSKDNGKEVLGYLEGSLKCFSDSLEKKIKAQGGEVFYGEKISGVEKEKATEQVKWVLQTFKQAENGAEKKVTEREAYDGVLFAVPQPVLSGILRNPVGGGQIPAIDHTAVICTVLVMDRPLTGKYWLNIGDRTLPFGGLIEHTNYLPASMYGGKHILYVSSYMLEEDPRFQLSEEAFSRLIYDGLKKVNVDFTETQVLARYIFKNQYAQPIIPLEYEKKKPQYLVGKDLEGLYQTNMAVIYPEDRGVNYSVRESKKAAEEMLRYLKLTDL